MPKKRQISIFFFSALLILGEENIHSQDLTPIWNEAKPWKLGLDGSVPQQMTSFAPFTENLVTPPNNPDIHLFSWPAHQFDPCIAVNWSNSNQLLAVLYSNVTGSSFESPWFFSTNTGLSWFGSESSPPPIIAQYGDAICFFDTQGRAYYIVLGSPGGIYVVSTTDFGATWSQRTNADPLNSSNDDAVHASADRSGFYPGNVYAAWTDFNIAGTPVQCTRSTDEGTTWSARRTLAIGSNRGQGAAVAIGPNGEVYVVWAHYTTGTGEVGIGISKSTNGGLTFGVPAVAFPINGIRVSNGGLVGLNGTRANSFPYADVDRSTGPRRGWVYVVTPELDVPNTGQSDIYLHRSADGGTTWNSPIRVNGPDVDPGKWQWMPSIAVDPSTGDITVSYNSMDSTGTNFMANRYSAYSTDGGDTWDRWVISDVRFLWSMIGTPQGQIYPSSKAATTALGGLAWSVWTDVRTGKSQVWLERIDYTQTSVQQEEKKSGLLPFSLQQNYPNPFNPSTTITYQLPVRSHVTLIVFDVLGREVATLVGGVEESGPKSVQWNASGVAGGVYLCRLTAGEIVLTRKLLLLR
jgi:hypothetical protein